MINALMVDVDGVIVHGRPEDGLHWSTSLQADLGLDPNELHSEFFAVHWEDVVAGRALLAPSLAQALNRVAPHLSPDELIAYWFARDSRVDSTFLQQLGAIRGAGFRVHLATNQEHRRARYLMETLGLAQHADTIQYSADLGIRKPFRGFFDKAASRVGLPPHQLLLVDDSIDNVTAAQAAGWNAAHWTGNQSLIEILDPWLAPPEL